MSDEPERIQSHDARPFSVSGIWLRRIGDEVQVLFEHDGHWYMGIQEHVEGNFSHIMEPLGMRARIEKKQFDPATKREVINA